MPYSLSADHVHNGTPCLFFPQQDEFSGLCNFNVFPDGMYSCHTFLREPRSLEGELTICDLAADTEYSLPLIFFNGAGGVTTIVINFSNEI